jgi:hypothetical protein
MFNILDITKNNVVAFKASGKIEEADYEKIIPLLEKTEREGKKIKLFIEIGDIQGITFKGLMKDIVTYFKHIKKIEKVAVVGKNGAGKGWAEAANPFIKAEIRYFPIEEKVLAEEWIEK